MRSIQRLVCLFGIVLLALGAAAKDKKPEAADQFSSLHFSVVKDYNGKPVRNASIVLHPVNKDGSQSRGGFQLKADADGKALSEGIPYGKLRVQVLAPGFQTYGEDFNIDKPDMDIEIRLKRPEGQFSVYDNGQGKGQPQESAPANPSPEPKPH